MPRYSIKHSEEGQSLVLILVVLVIGAVIAFAIAARTIQDIRRTGEERISSQAATQVETALDITTSAEIWDLIWDSDSMTFVDGVCTPETEGKTICCLNDSFLDENFPGYADDEDGCESETASVCLRLEDRIIERYIEKDDVFEINLATAAAGGSFTIYWTPDDTSAGKMIVKKYQIATDGTDVVSLNTASAYSADATSDWGTYSQESGQDIATVTFDRDGSDGQVDKFIRIRAIGSGMTISTDAGIPPQELSARVTCTISGIYREFVRAIPLYSYLPACFDYVLFDGSTKVEDFETF